MLKISRRKEDFDKFHEMMENEYTFNRLLPYEFRELLSEYGIYTKQQLLSFCYDGFYSLSPYQETEFDKFDVKVILECMKHGLINFWSIAHQERIEVFAIYYTRFMYILYHCFPEEDYNFVKNRFTHNTLIWGVPADSLLYAFKNATRDDVEQMLQEESLFDEWDLYLFYSEDLPELMKTDESLKILYNIVEYHLLRRGILIEDDETGEYTWYD